MGGISNFHAKINFAKSKISSDKKKLRDRDTIDDKSLITLARQTKKLEKLESKLSNPNESLAEKTLERLKQYYDEIETVLNLDSNDSKNYIDSLKNLKSNTTREMVRKAIEEAKSKPDKTEEIFNQLKVDLNIRQFQLNCKKQNTTEFQETKESLKALSNQASSIKTALQSMKSYQQTTLLKKSIDALNLASITLPNDFNDSKVKQKVENLTLEIKTNMQQAHDAKYFNSFQTLQNIIDKVKELSAILDQITAVSTEKHLDLHLTKDKVSEHLAEKKSDLTKTQDALEKAIIDSLGTSTDEINKLKQETDALKAEIKILTELQKKYHGSVDQIYDNQLQKWKTGKYKLLMSSTASNLDSKLKPAEREVVEEFEWQKTSSEATFIQDTHFSIQTTFKQSKSIDDLIKKTTTRASRADLNAETKSRLDARIEELKSIKAEMTGSKLLGYVGWAGDTPTKEEQNAKLSQIQVLVFRKQDGNLEYKFLKEVAAKDDLFEEDGSEKANLTLADKTSMLLKNLSVDLIQGGGEGDDDPYTQGLETLRQAVRGRR